MLRTRHSGFEKPVGLQGQYLARQFNSTKGGVLVPSGTPSCTSRKYTEGSQVSHVARHGVKEMDTVKWAGGLPGLGSQAGWATCTCLYFSGPREGFSAHQHRASRALRSPSAMTSWGAKAVTPTDRTQGEGGLWYRVPRPASPGCHISGVSSPSPGPSQPPGDLSLHACEACEKLKGNWRTTQVPDTQVASQSGSGPS